MNLWQHLTGESVWLVEHPDGGKWLKMMGPTRQNGWVPLHLATTFATKESAEQEIRSRYTHNSPPNGGIPVEFMRVRQTS